MNQIDNTFTGGLNLDSNPITVTSNQLTNCLNGTIKTFNGNENMLQNDMGNVKVDRAYLPAGYVPVGMAEHGGIIYVASKNPTNGQCQLGSFPSPEVYIDSSSESSQQQSLDVSDFITYDGQLKTTNVIKKLTDTKVYTGDEYVITKGETETTNPFADKISVSLGVKSNDGSIVKIQDYITDDLMVYTEPTPGELYLIGEFKIPEDFYVSEKWNDGKFTLSSNYKFTGTINERTVTSTTDSNKNVYEASISWEDSYPDNITYSVLPIILDEGAELKIPQLEIQKTVDLKNTNQTSAFYENSWGYTYNEQKNQLKITHGYTNADAINKVIFNFYEYTTDSNGSKFQYKHTENISKLNYNGVFTDVITDKLSEYCLYLLQIQVQDEESQNLIDDVYKFIWTNELLNKTKGKGSIQLNLVRNVNIEIDDSNPVVNDLERILENLQTSKAQNEDFENTITCTKTFPIYIKTGDCYYVEKDKIPFEFDLKYYLDPNSVTITPTIESEEDSFDYYGEYHLTKNTKEVSYIYDSEDKKIKLTSTFKFQASAIAGRVGENTYKIDKYFNCVDQTQVYGDQVTLTVDLDRIELPKYSIGVSMGNKLKSLSNERNVNTYYALKEKNSEETSDLYDVIVKDHDNKNKNGLCEASHRSWELINNNLTLWLHSTIGYLPQIIFINSKACPGNMDDSLMYDKYLLESDGGARNNLLFVPDSINTNFSKSDASWHNTPYYNWNKSLLNEDNVKSDYAIILWLGGDGVYHILKTCFTNIVNAVYSLQNVFDDLYISKLESSDGEKLKDFYVVNDKNYGYTTERSYSATVTVNISDIGDNAQFSIDNKVKDALKRVVKESKSNDLSDIINDVPQELQFTINYVDNLQKLTHTCTIDPDVNMSKLLSEYTHNLLTNSVLYDSDTKDGNNNPLLTNTLYILNDKGKLIPLNSVDDSHKLVSLKDKLEVGKNNAILIKNTNSYLDLINKDYNKALEVNSFVPCIGDSLNIVNPDDRGELLVNFGYPLSFVQGYDYSKGVYVSNQKYLTDITIPTDEEGMTFNLF